MGQRQYIPSIEDRELVTKMAAEGHSLQEIADKLGRTKRLICAKYGPNLKEGRQLSLIAGLKPKLDPRTGEVKVEISDQQREMIRMLSGQGLRDDQVALLVRIPMTTMLIHCREDLNIGKAEAHDKVTKTLFDMAVDKDHVNATMFYLKTQCGWRETSNIEFPDKHGNPQNITGGVNINISADKMQTLIALLNDTV